LFVVTGDRTEAGGECVLVLLCTCVYERILYSLYLLTGRSQAGKFSKIFARCARRQILIQILENPYLPQPPRPWPDPCRDTREPVGVLAQRDPVSIRLRISKRVEARPPPLESGGALDGPRNQTKHMRGGGRTPPGVGPDPLVCAQRVLKTRPRRATILLSLAEPRRHSAENTALPGRLTHSLFVKIVNPPPSPTTTYGIGHE
jgi:hypothetical protein